MSTVNLSRYSFNGNEGAAPIENLANLPAADKERLVHAGIDVNDHAVSGAFMQLNHAGVHCRTSHEGLDLMDIRQALKKFDGLPQYYWKLLDPNKDEITRMAYEHLNGGYFVRARKGVKISQPVQSCMFIKGNAAGQVRQTRALDQLIQEAADLARIAAGLAGPLLAMVQLLDHLHRQVDVVLLELEQGSGVVHQHVGIQNIDTLA